MDTLSMMTTGNGHVSNYRFPSVELLEKRNDGKEKISIAEIAENENRLKHALEQLGIKIARIETTIGAAITRYEVTLLPGYKLKRLEAELALPLGVLRGRMAEIDPFRPAIIIEIPNTNRGDCIHVFAYSVRYIPGKQSGASAGNRTNRGECTVYLGFDRNIAFTDSWSYRPRKVCGSACHDYLAALQQASHTAEIRDDRS